MENESANFFGLSGRHKYPDGVFADLENKCIGEIGSAMDRVDRAALYVNDIKLAGLSAPEIERLIPYNPVLLVYRGSIAHGMYIPNTDPNSIDDKDLMGVYIAEPRYYFGLEHNRWSSVETALNEWDVVSYELRKFVSLLIKSNPNVLSALWVDPKYIVYQSEIGKRLRENRNLFVSKKAYHSFNGYAHGQMKRMKKGEFHGWMGAKRKRLVEQFGYSTKESAHLIRILKMGIEFLTEGQLHVEREDASTLLAIKRGEWSLDEVQSEADRLFALAEEAYVRSTLPVEPDYRAAENLLVDMIREGLC